MFETISSDVRVALRGFAKRPGFAAIAILTLALGIGATTAIFSVVNGVLLRPLPYTAQERLVQVRHRNVKEPRADGLFSPQDQADLATARVFEKQSAYWYSPDISGANVSGTGQPVRLSVASVDGEFFPILGVNALHGRAIGPAETTSKQRVIVLSERIWRTRYGSDRSLIGNTLRIDGDPFVVLGVMPDHFQYPAASVDAWRPITLMTDDDVPHRRGIRWRGMVARLAPGQTVEGATTAVNGVLATLAKQYPDSNEHWQTADVIPLKQSITGNVRTALLVLLAAVGFVLMIACANVANLLLVRANARSREVAVRAALGASRGRVVMQMLTENIVLSLLGGVLGVLAATAGVRALVTFAGARIARADEIGMSAGVLLFALVVSILTGLVAGALPALRASLSNMQLMLREGGRTGTEGRSRGRVRSTLVVVETALAVVLVIGAALMVKSFVRLIAVDPGFRAERVVSFAVSLPSHVFTEDFQTRPNQYRTALLDRLRELPGVTAAGGSKTMLLEGGGEPYTFSDGPGDNAQRIGPAGGAHMITPDYFRTLDIRILQGREFTMRDDPKNPAIIINRAMADQYWPNQDALSKAIWAGPDRFPIIGVVDNVRHEGVSAAPVPVMYVPLSIFSRGSLKVYVRTAGDPASMMESVRKAVATFDPDLPIADLAPLPAVVSEAVTQPRFLALLLGLFAGFALLLAALGMYGVIAYGVSQRLQEIGIRIALGAVPSQVVAMVIRQALGLALAGCAFGLAAGFALTRSLSSVLYEVSATDPVTFMVVPAALLLVALLAATLPAVRATRADPVSALR